MKTIVVATFNTVAPAQRLQYRLRKAGIEAIIKDQTKLERYWFLSEPLAAIHLEVEVPQYLPARNLIARLDPADEVIRESVRCPDCGCSRIEYPQVTRKFLMPILESLLMAVHIVPRKFYCCDCHYTWPLKQAIESQLDVLGWPRDSKMWHPEGPGTQPKAPEKELETTAKS